MSRHPLPFRLGSTSYVYPADILPNVRRLAGVVDDIELVLFEVEDYSNLPDRATVAELKDIAARYDLSYTVHLPLDLRLGSGDEALRHPSIGKALKVIRATRELEPWAYIVHLDGAEPLVASTPSAWERWQGECVQALEFLARECGDAKLLCIENLESYPLERVVPILEELPASLCLDVGHFWLAGADPLPYLRRYLNRARVVHIHGVAGRDHKSLACVPAEALHAVLSELCQRRFRGVVTLEQFSQEEFFTSWKLLLQWADSTAFSKFVRNGYG